MEKLIINGGRRLSGVITPHGSKNAALPLIFASLAADGVSEIRGVPNIADVRIAIELVRSQGVAAEFSEGLLILDARRAKYKKPDRALTSSIRASSYLLGASLARFGRFSVSEIGGCNFCNRPIDMHVSAATRLGAYAEGDELRAGKLVGCEIKFDKPSVGATVNALIMAASAEGVTHIFGAASEPHVHQVIEFLISAGASIKATEGAIEVRGAHLNGGSIEVIPDMIEAGTYMLAGALTGGEITVKGGGDLGLGSFFDPLASAGCSVVFNENGVTVCGLPYDRMRVKTEPYPGYPTDLQPQIAPLMAMGAGGIITETVWADRFSYLEALSLFGLRYRKEGKTAFILPSKLHCARSFATDLRGGAAAVLAALAVSGESEIEKSEILMRGYSELAENLLSLGADVKIVKEN